MLPHLKLLLFLVSLIVGVWSVVRLRQIQAAFPSLVLDALTWYTAVVNAALWLVFLFMYADLNLSGLVSRPLTGRPRDVVDLLITSVVLSLVYFMFRIAWGLLERPVPAVAGRVTLGAGLVLGCGYLVRLAVPAASPALGWVDWVRRWVIENLLLLELVFLGIVWFAGRRHPDALRRRMTRGFVLLHIGRYALLVALAVGIWTTGLGEAARTPVSFLVIAAIAAAPAFWAQWLYVPVAERTPAVPDDPAWFESVVAEFGLTRRELDVLRLLLSGKTNKDIEALLGISVHTVKNHVYNIFNKMGVESRYQLVHLLVHRRTR